MWRINREAVLLGAGPAALLLQVAHPLIAEGVAQHSDFQGDPFGRLRRTLRHDHGPGVRRRADGRARHPAAERRPRHGPGRRARTRRQRASAGADGYRALDPELLLWVQATLVVTSVRRLPALGRAAVRRRARGVLGRRRAAVGRAHGHPARRSARPTGRRSMAYWDRMLAPNGPIQVTATARRAGADARAAAPAPGARAGRSTCWRCPGLALLPDAHPRRRTASRGAPRASAAAAGVARPVRPCAGPAMVPARLARDAPGARCRQRRAAPRRRGAHAVPATIRRPPRGA